MNKTILIKNSTQKLGFSLLELSMALVVIAILVVAIAKGGQILQSSRIAAAQSLTKSSPIPRISNLLVWYETTMEDSFSEADFNSGSIGTWRNLNPTTRGNNATQATAANQPTYAANVLNGLPVLRFDSTNDFMSIANFDIMRNVGAGGFAIFAVVAKTQNARGDFFSYKTADSADDFGLYIDNSVVSHYLSINGANSFWAGGTTNVGQRFNVLTFTRDNSSNYVGRVNGASDFTRTTLSNFSNFNAGTPLFIGSNHDASLNPAFPFGGDIAEIIIFNRALNNDERREIEAYLGKKWKIMVI